MSVITLEKNMLREHYRSMRRKMTTPYKRNLDIEIASRVLTSDEYINSELLLIYCATEEEIETRHIIRAALLNKKRVALPRCEGDGIMKFYEIKSLSELERGRFKGILEPPAHESRLVKNFDKALCIVPALSYDPKGQRLGMGGGYYDRFLRNFDGVSAGLCYSSFIKWDIPRENHDMAVDVLITEGYVRKIGN